MACIKDSIFEEMRDHLDVLQVFLSVPMCLKVSPKGCHIFNWLS